MTNLLQAATQASSMASPIVLLEIEPEGSAEKLDQYFARIGEKSGSLVAVLTMSPPLIA